MNKDTGDKKTISEDTAKKLIKVLTETPKGTALKSYEIAKKPVTNLQNNQILAWLTATLGLIFFAFGVESLISAIPQFAQPIILISLGLILLTFAALFFKKVL